MNISIIVVAYNEESNIEDCINSLISQKYSKGTFEIIVVDGMSEDSTPNLVMSYCNRHKNIRMITNSKRTIASNRNVGIEHAKYPYIAFTDADCICPPYWIDRLANEYLNLISLGYKVGAVGGGNTVGDQFGPITESIGIAFDSYVSALGSVQSKLIDQVQRVDSLACLNVLYNKKEVEEVGKFDESLMNLGEDWDLNFRLRKRGCDLFYIPGATVIHKMRSTISSFAKQMYQYGIGRANLIKKNKTINLRYLAPLLFIASIIIFPLSYFIFDINYFLIPSLYFPITILYSLFLCKRKKRFYLFPIVSLIFYIIHFGYSFGELKGLILTGKGDTF